MRAHLFVGSFALAGLLALGATAWAQGLPEAQLPQPGMQVPQPGAQAAGQAAQAQAPAKPEAPALDESTASCAEILSAPAHGEEEQSPAVADVIFHHVSDSYVVAFESPISHGSASFDFKRLECRLTGWNGIVHVGGFPLDLTPTKHLFWMWVAALVLILLFASAKPKKDQLVTHGTAALLEMMVLFVRDEIARKTIPGKGADRFTPYLLTAFFFILTMNLLGLVPFMASATSNIGVTMGLALLTFILTQAAGIKAAGVGGYLKHLTGGVHPLLWPIMVPVEVLGLFTKPFALTIRLFANMVAGHIVIFFLLGLIFILKSAAIAPVSVAFAFAIYLLEIFVSLVQAYVFTMLSSLFIGFGVAMGEHEHGETASGAQGGEHAEHVVHH
jgi:F-type H+-transporting ATPase subunit a